MHFTVELLFDPNSTALLQQISTEIQARYGPPPDPRYKAPPHIRLISFEDEPVPLRRTVEKLASRFGSLDVQMDSVDAFPQGAVYVAPSDTDGLLHIHRMLHQELADQGVRNDWANLQPGVWRPHCTVAVGIPPDKRQQAIASCHKMLPKGRFSIDKLAVLTYQPFNELERYELGRV